MYDITIFKYCLMNCMLIESIIGIVDVEKYNTKKPDWNKEIINCNCNILIVLLHLFHQGHTV